MRVLSKLVLIGGLALSCGGMPALAQTVALPLEPSPQGSAPDASSSPFVPAPDNNQPVQPQYPQAVPGRQSVPAVPMAAPSARPGLATPAANRQALAVPGFTPDQVAAARRSLRRWPPPIQSWPNLIRSPALICLKTSSPYRMIF